MWITVREAANIMDCHPETIRRWCKSGKLEAKRSSNMRLGWRINDKDLRTKYLWYSVKAPDATYTRIKALRYQHHKSILDVANDNGIDAGTYSNYERGKRIIPSKIVVKLALYYGVTTDYLLCMDLYKEEIQNG